MTEIERCPTCGRCLQLASARSAESGQLLPCIDCTEQRVVTLTSYDTGRPAEYVRNRDGFAWVRCEGDGHLSEALFVIADPLHAIERIRDDPEDGGIDDKIASARARLERIGEERFGGDRL